MQRSYPLTVDRLEDRCVPSANSLVPVVVASPLVATDSTAVVVQTATPKQPIDVSQAPIAPQAFVIDGYLIDPNAIAPPPKPLFVDPGASIPDVYWQTSPLPQTLVPPINDPFWY